jgi:hypothetical protein
VNHLEAMSQWAAFSKMRVAFHLYVPIGCVDSARRLCTDLQIPVTEVWAYHAVGDQMRFTPVQRAPQASDGKRAASPGPAAAPKPASPTRTAASRPRPSTPAAPARRPAAAAGTARRKPAAAKAKAAAPKRAAVKTTRKTAARAARPQKRR